MAALLTTDRRVTGQARVFAFCTALFSCLVCVHSVQERISPLKRPKHCASQSLMRRTVKKNPDLTRQRKMTKQTLAVLETTKQATSMTKLRLQPEQESHWVHCRCHCPKELHQQNQPLHHSFGLYSSQLTRHRSFSIKVTRRIESQSQRHLVAYISAVGYEPDRSGACNGKAFKLLLLIF